MSEFILGIAEIALAPAMIIGAITYLAKCYISSVFTNKQKAYEIELKNRLDTDLHAYKEHLSNQNLRYRVKVAGVYEKQADILVSLYQQISDMNSIMHEYSTASSSNKLEIFNTLELSYRTMGTYYLRNKILIPESTDNLMNSLLLIRIQDTTSDPNGDTLEELSKQISTAKIEITRAFRDVVGVL